MIGKMKLWNVIACKAGVTGLEQRYCSNIFRNICMFADHGDGIYISEKKGTGFKKCQHIFVKIVKIAF